MFARYRYRALATIFIDLSASVAASLPVTPELGLAACNTLASKLVMSKRATVVLIWHDLHSQIPHSSYGNAARRSSIRATPLAEQQ